MWDTLQRRNDQKMKYLQDNGSMCFDSVTDMKSSNLDAGQTAFTKGYYSINDGGAGVYSIRGKVAGETEDGGSVIFLENGNVAELITDGTVNAKQFGAYGDGTHDDSNAIQTVLDYVKAGTVIIPENTYLVDNDITIYNKGDDSLQKRFKLIATGAKFIGMGQLVIDSSRRISVSGLQMLTQDMCLRGCWWSDFDNIQVRTIKFGDQAGTRYSSEYWVNFKDIILQCAEVGGEGNTNEITFYSCAFIGSATHGFVQSFNYAFIFHKNIQSWKIIGGDVSYYTNAIYHADSDDINFDIYFFGTYFDSLLPQLPTSDKQRIETIACKNAEGAGSRNPVATIFQNAMRSRVGMWSPTHDYEFNGMTLFNLIPGGDMQNDLGTWIGNGKPIYSANDSIITCNSGGLHGYYLNINQPKTSSNGVNFKTMNFPLLKGVISASMVLRNADVGTKTIRVGFAGIYYDVKISHDSWSLFTASTYYNGSNNFVNMGAFTTDNTSYNIDVAYAGVTYGNNPAVFAPSRGFTTINKTIENWSSGSIPAGGKYFEDITVQGVKNGDFIEVSVIGYQSPLLDINLRAVPNGANTVRVIANNLSSTAQEITSTTLCIKVTKRLLE